MDQVVHQIEPSPEYDVHLLDDCAGRGSLNGDNVIVAIEVPRSFRGPHMAPDNKYYIRAGAHTLPARHFIVESIWARRHVSHPKLVHLATLDPYTNQSAYFSLELLAVTDAPALNVIIDCTPPPNSRLSFPISVPVIDRNHSYSLRFEVPNAGSTFTVKAEYEDASGNPFVYESEIDTTGIVTTYNRKKEPMRDIARTLESIERKLR